MSYRVTPLSDLTPAKQKRRIVTALKRARTVTWAAKELGVSRRHLTRLITELKIDTSNVRAGEVTA